ncbi:MAG: hypothetical protein RMJ54_18105 [Roseiflexaceae bacterium]|nr:hypothetical protein [Roseiflexaceae bacterium]
MRPVSSAGAGGTTIVFPTSTVGAEGGVGFPASPSGGGGTVRPVSSAGAGGTTIVFPASPADGSRTVFVGGSGRRAPH